VAGKIAISTRMYRQSPAKLAVFAQEGTATFKDLDITTMAVAENV
jgi:hypothetical protein